MRKSSLVILVLLLMVSCGVKKNRETYSLLEVFLNEDLEQHEAVYLIDESYSNWGCQVNGELWPQSFYSEIEGETSMITGGPLRKVLAEDDIEKICEKATGHIKFSSLKINTLGVNLIGKEAAKFMLEEYTKQWGDAKHVFDKIKIYEVSQPVFFNDGRFAFIFYSDWSQSNRNDAYVVYEKIADEWEEVIRMPENTTLISSR